MTPNIDLDNKDNKQPPLKVEEWVRNRYKEEIDKSSTKHPVMTLVKTKADEKVQEILKSFYSSDEKVKKEFKDFNEKDYSVFNHEKIQASFFDKFILFPGYTAYKKLEKLNKDLQIVEKARKTVKGFRITKYSIYFTGYIDNLFEKKYLKFIEFKDNNRKNLLKKKKASEAIEDAKSSCKSSQASIVAQGFTQAGEKPVIKIKADENKEKKVEQIIINEIKAKRIGLITNVNQLQKTEISVAEDGKPENISSDANLKAKAIIKTENKSFIGKLKSLFKTETSSSSSISDSFAANGNSKKIGIAALQKSAVKLEIEGEAIKSNQEPNITSKSVSKESVETQVKIKQEKIESKENQTLKANADENNADEININNNNTEITYSNVIEELDQKFKNLQEYKKPHEKILEENRIIRENLLAKEAKNLEMKNQTEVLNKRKINEETETEAADASPNKKAITIPVIPEGKLNLKDLKLNFKAWIYFRFMCPETKKQLKFYKGLKSHDIFVNKAFKEILESFEKNLFNETKLKTKRIANFWRVAFNIKPDYIIDFDDAKNKILQKQKNKSSLLKNNLAHKSSSNINNAAKAIQIGVRYSIFYKLLFIAKPLNVSYSSLNKAIFCLAFAFFANFRYNMYKTNKAKFDLANHIQDKYLEEKFNVSFTNSDYNEVVVVHNNYLDGFDDAKESKENKALCNCGSLLGKSFEMKSNIFTAEKDEFYAKLLALEKMLLAYSKEFISNNEAAYRVNDESPSTSASASADTSGAAAALEQIKQQNILTFFEKNKSAQKVLDLIDSDFIKLYNEMLDLTEMQNYLNIAIKNSLILFYSGYNLVFSSAIRRRILFKNAFGKTLVFSFFINEFAKYLEFFIYVQKFNFASEKLLKDNSEIFRYYFFRENINNNLIETNKQLI